jgi:hypothetical protein
VHGAASTGTIGLRAPKRANAISSRQTLSSVERPSTRLRTAACQRPHGEPDHERADPRVPRHRRVRSSGTLSLACRSWRRFYLAWAPWATPPGQRERAPGTERFRIGALSRMGGWAFNGWSETPAQMFIAVASWPRPFREIGGRRAAARERLASESPSEVYGRRTAEEINLRRWRCRGSRRDQAIRRAQLPSRISPSACELGLASRACFTVARSTCSASPFNPCNT